MAGQTQNEPDRPEYEQRPRLGRGPAGPFEHVADELDVFAGLLFVHKVLSLIKYFV